MVVTQYYYEVLIVQRERKRSKVVLSLVISLLNSRFRHSSRSSMTGDGVRSVLDDPFTRVVKDITFLPFQFPVWNLPRVRGAGGARPAVASRRLRNFPACDTLPPGERKVAQVSQLTIDPLSRGERSTGKSYSNPEFTITAL